MIAHDPQNNPREPECETRWSRPATKQALHAWIERELELTIPTEALVDGHAAPFDYLCHAYFDGGVPEGDGALPVVRRASPDSVVWANRGGGKTFLAALATLLDMIFKPGIEIRVLGGSLDQSKRIHAHLRSLLAKPSMAGLVDGRITERRIRFNNASNVELLAQSQTSVRGTRVQKLRCDEVELFDPEVWEAAQLTTISKRCGDVLVPGTIECLSTMHVPYGLMYRLVREASTMGPGTRHSGLGETQADAASGGPNGKSQVPDPSPSSPGRRLFKWGVVDVLGACDEAHECESCELQTECDGRAKARDAGGHAPGHLPVRDAIDLKRRVGEATWAAEMLGARPRRTDCVLPEFDPKTHVAGALPTERSGWAWIAGMDFGVRAPTVVLFAGVDPEGVVWVADERITTGELLATHIDAIRTGPPEAPAPDWIGVDPAGRQRHEQTGLSNVQVMRRAGLKIRDRRVGIFKGLDLLRARLRPAAGAPRLFVHERCVKLIESLERYRYPSDRPECLIPIKDGSDHAVDALRYMIQNLDLRFRVEVSSY